MTSPETRVAGSTRPVLALRVDNADGGRPLTFVPERLVCCGWVGRDRAALQAHIDELAHVGVKPPTRVPIFMNFSPGLLTLDDEMEVVSQTTSGEVEYVLLCRGDDMWVTVGSDQTDRSVETHSIVASKQMCGKYVASRCWAYADVAAHWDQLLLRCWITAGAERSLYQESPLAAILAPGELVARLPGGLGPVPAVLFSGTIATRGGLVYADAYELELEDPVLGRSIRGSYRVRTLAQHT
ncbi:MAG TPA: DUF2848 domain-containing protein [Vicinamibacterales bacterium]|nr:DUF2848 domain-containing protein [Vicinamibacterales bacterium]